jgi:hypothetical protein
MNEYKKETTTTATPSEAETSTIAGGSKNNTNRKITFPALARRFISFCREDIIKMKDGSEESQFKTLVEIFNPTHPKIKQMKINYHTISFDNHDCIQNVLFVLKVLTEILREKKDQEMMMMRKRRKQHVPSTTRVGNGMIQSVFLGKKNSLLVHEEIFETFEDIQILMTKNSACHLVIEIISSSPFYFLKKQALLFGIELLWNGNKESQDSLLNYWYTHHSIIFFQSIYLELQSLIRHRREINFNFKKKKLFSKHFKNLQDDEVQVEVGIRRVNVEEEILFGLDSTATTLENECGSNKMLTNVYRFLQLLCEGHNYDIQMLLEDQSSLYSSHIQKNQFYSIQKSYGLLSETVLLLNEFIPFQEGGEMSVSEMTNEDALAIKVMLEFLIESVQGPCHYNQEILATNPMLFDVVDRIWHATGFAPNKNEKLHQELPTFPESESNQVIGYHTMKILKTTALTLRLSLLEGRKLSTTDVVVQIFMQKDHRCE